MSELTVGARYAKSLLDLAIEQSALEAVKADMDFFAQTLKANSELQAVMRNPIIAHDKKVNILKAIFGDKVSKVTDAFFNLMINNSRGELLYTTAHEFVKLYNIKMQIVKAQVTSATPLADATKVQLADAVKAAIGGIVELDAKVDPALIGGFVLTVGDKQIDASIANSLKKLNREFAQKSL
jgi:F-type H+-transporting ATPase subunit delta